VEAAQLTLLGPVLVQERDARLVELLEEFVPADFIKGFVVAEADAEHAGIVAAALGAFDAATTRWGASGGGDLIALIDESFDAVATLIRS